jgi:hypothetical protein
MFLIEYNSTDYPTKFNTSLIKISYPHGSGRDDKNYLKISDELIYEYWLIDVIESDENIIGDYYYNDILGKYSLKINEDKYNHLQTILKIKDSLTLIEKPEKKKIMDIIDKALYDLSEGYYEKN